MHATRENSIAARDARWKVPALTALVLPRDRRYLFAGTADRIAPPAQVRALWKHWQQPETVWYEGSYLSFHREPRLWSWVRTVLQATLCAKPIAFGRAITQQAA